MEIRHVLAIACCMIQSIAALGQEATTEDTLLRSLSPQLVEQFSSTDIKSLQADILRVDLLQARRKEAEYHERLARLQLRSKELLKGLHRAQLQTLLVLAQTPGGLDSISTVPESTTSSSVPLRTQAFPQRIAIWKTRIIPVYWENPTTENEEERNWIREAVINTWEKHSALRFVGWEKVKPDSKGIRILLADSHPHVKRLGRFLSGKQNGMELNITFRNWCPQCVVGYGRRKSIEWIAIHEFGHALGFAHEHNRDDRDQRCAEEPQGSDGDWKLTVYDPDSVMNYCNRDWNNNGELSELDVLGLQILYGEPNEKSDPVNFPSDAELDPGPDPLATRE